MQKVIYIGLVIGWQTDQFSKQNSYNGWNYETLKASPTISKLINKRSPALYLYQYHGNKLQHFFDNVTFILFMSGHPANIVMLCNFSLWPNQKIVFICPNPSHFERVNFCWVEGELGQFSSMILFLFCSRCFKPFFTKLLT